MQSELEMYRAVIDNVNAKARIRLYSEYATRRGRHDHLHDFAEVVRYCGNSIGAGSEDAQMPQFLRTL